MRYVTGLVILIAASMACSRGNDRGVAQSPTSPTAVAETTIAYVGGVSGPMDVLFPGRNESFVFRNDLETKYATSLGRAPVGTFVDKEGEVVWLQEYIRYRVNGCDHATAMSRVLTQIDGGAAGGICAAPPEGVINYPPRDDVFAARRALETKYQQMGRGLSPSSVDQEGAAIWITEYLRYRTNGCSHAEAEAKVFSQIDGGPVPPICSAACGYVLSPGGLNTGSSSLSDQFEVRPAAGASPTCTWTARSSASWLTFASTQSPGAGFTVFPYSVGPNSGGDRTGFIDFTWAGGGTRFQVNQTGTPFVANFTMVDPFRSVSETDECWFRSTSTPCNFTSSANLPGNTYTYDWSATYEYGTTKTFVQSGASSMFSFSDSCGGSGATAEGTTVELIVTLTITDNLGNSVTMRSGGNRPPLRVRLFTC
jgi:Putative binding domain, N-terminal